MDKSIHTVQLFKGLVNPKEEFSNMNQADNVAGLGWRIILLSVISAVIGGLSSRLLVVKLGVTANVQAQLQQAGIEINDQLLTTISTVSGVLTGLFAPIVTMLIAALFFLIFFSDIGYKKLFATELYLQVITVIASAVSLAMMMVLQTAGVTLSLGAITGIFLDSAYLNGIFAGITIFLIWKLFVQILAYRQLSERDSNYTFWVLIIINVILLMLFSGGSATSPEMMQL